MVGHVLPPSSGANSNSLAYNKHTVQLIEWERSRRVFWHTDMTLRRMMLSGWKKGSYAKEKNSSKQ